MTPRRHPPATVPPDHPAAKLPRRRLAVLRPGMEVEGVITRMVRGGVLVDIFLESGEPAFVPLAEIPAKSMPKVRGLLESGAMQKVRLIQLDRSSGTATASLHGLLELPKKPQPEPEAAVPAPPPAPVRTGPPPPGTPPTRTSASDRARRQQEEILKRLRGG